MPSLIDYDTDTKWSSLPPGIPVLWSPFLLGDNSQPRWEMFRGSRPRQFPRVSSEICKRDRTILWTKLIGRRGRRVALVKLGRRSEIFFGKGGRTVYLDKDESKLFSFCRRSGAVWRRLSTALLTPESDFFALQLCDSTPLPSLVPSS